MTLKSIRAKRGLICSGRCVCWRVSSQGVFVKLIVGEQLYPGLLRVIVNPDGCPVVIRPFCPHMVVHLYPRLILQVVDKLGSGTQRNEMCIDFSGSGIWGSVGRKEPPPVGGRFATLCPGYVRDVDEASARRNAEHSHVLKVHGYRFLASVPRIGHWTASRETKAEQEDSQDLFHRSSILQRWSHTFLDATAAGNSVHSFVGFFYFPFRALSLVNGQ